MAKSATKSQIQTPQTADIAGSAKRRQVIFFLSPRLIDFDTYLPIAMALKAARPAWRIRFAVFSGANHQVILSNPTLVAGLERCGTLHKVGGSGSRSALARWVNRATGFARVTAWVVSSPRPVLFHGRQFTSWPYAVWYLLARLLGGRGIILARARLPDDGIHPHRRAEYQLPERSASMIERLFGRDNDGLVHYHDRQSLYLKSLAHYGRLDSMQRRLIGLPSRLPEWQRLIESKTEEERERLVRANKNLDEIYCFFSAKGYSSTHLRNPDSAQATFR